MTIYIATILTLAFFAILETRGVISENAKRVMYAVAFWLLVLQTGLRWDMATDWYPYYEHFRMIENFSETIPSSAIDFEFGYSFALWLVKQIIPHYTFYLLVHAVVYYLLIFKGVKQYAAFPFLTLLFSYCFMIGYMGSNRQLIALAICLFSLQYVMKKEPKKFVALLVLAMLFHATAFIFSIYYFLNRNIRIRYIIGTVVVSIVIGVTFLPQWTFQLIGTIVGGRIGEKLLINLSVEGNAIDAGLTLVGLLKRILFVVIFSFGRKNILSTVRYYNLMYNGYMVGICIYFLFALSPLAVFISRGGLYWNITEAFLISSQVLLVKRSQRFIVVLAYTGISFWFFFQSIKAYPEIFIPYNSVFI